MSARSGFGARGPDAMKAALPPGLSEERRNKIYSGNAKALYRLD